MQCGFLLPSQATYSTVFRLPGRASAEALSHCCACSDTGLGGIPSLTLSRQLELLIRLGL